MMFEKLFLTQAQIKDLLNLLNVQKELPETLEDVKAQLIDTNSAK